MSNVAVVGGSGFVGYHLCEKLVGKGDNVTVLDNMEHGKNEPEGAHLIQIDATDMQSMAVALRGHDTVYNLAASVGGIYFNEANQEYQLYSNFNLQTIPLMAAKMAGVERFLQVSSVCIYDPEIQSEYANVGGIHENHGLDGRPQQANAGYAWAKRMGEEAAALSSIPHVVIVRPSNIGGPRDYFDEHAHVIPALVKRAFRSMSPVVMFEKEPMKVYGNPEFVREFIHVEDVAAGMIAALESGYHGHAYNLGSGDTITIRDLATKIAYACWKDRVNAGTLMGQWIRDILFMGGEGGDPFRLSDSSKAINELDWRAEKSIDNIVEGTVQWYRESQL